MDLTPRSLWHSAWAVAVAFFMVLMTMLLPSSAQASNNDNMRMTDYGIRYVVGKDGGVDVTENLTIRYDDDSHHGFERFLITAQKYNGDKHRVYPVSRLAVSSSTGAPTHLKTEVQGAAELLRVGNEDEHVSGTQRYTLTYHLSNVVNRQPNGTTEFYPNALGTQWRIPIDRVEIDVTGPGPISRARCGYGSKAQERPCTATTGTSAHFAASGADLLKGGMSIDAAMPTKSFTSTSPYLVDGPDAEALGAGGPLSQTARRDVTWAGSALSVAVPVIVGLAMLRRRRTTGQDEYFDGVPPGSFPPEGTEPVIRRGPKRQAAVRFEPPKDAAPALVGTVMRKTVEDRDVAATIVDLAVRNYLTLEELGNDDWLLRAKTRPSGDTLLDYEADLLNALFEKGSEVRLSDLRETFSGHLTRTKRELYRQVVNRGWFAKSPEQSRADGLSLVWPFAVLAVVAFVVAEIVQVTPVALCAGFVVTTLLVYFMTREGGARTAAGSAVNDQARGFELYLRTAEAKQFRYEDAERIFSRYMPYAIVLGLAEHWARLFGEVAQAANADGYPLSMPLWYVPYGGSWGMGGFDSFQSLGSSLSSFSSSASSALSATQGSSGGSGFSGGGFSGGGFGGGGGGGW